tara:strand:- start:285 stop:803 length:519 start_codon:yes stop_codon:yes gene_type:complete
MSKPKNVLVAVGETPTPRLPRQDYKNITTKYNIPLGIMAPPQSDAEFFNSTIGYGLSGDVPRHIYGFLKGAYRYSSPSSIQEIVDVFSMDDDIEIVTTDILIKNPATNAEFTDYGHSEAIPNLPFFVRDSLIDSVSFENSNEIFHKVLQDLVSRGKKVYHIAEPLLTEEINE